MAAAGTAYATVYRDDVATSAESAHDVVAAADDGTVALLSYSPKSLDADLAKGQSHLTGQFLTYYKEFTTKVVKPAATENNVETKAQVIRSAVSRLSADDAQVLSFVNQSTTSKTKPEPELTSSSVKISLQRVNGEWLISSFDPV
ncbi:twin-arginine translocation pathway signal [Gordonia sp. SID5947]|uniref:twin-arginine translocation pathway signal n=1 Tax=Gordonia sp. SID5947 TaxID=2690315 RepID=UPI0013690BC0|nr:twin-arginine translocation pathway signal [Gordonia sp. SID5947]MYR06852.1 twin-arginine translocation pathway signal [Gordonia sp. SID5947]